MKSILSTSDLKFLQKLHYKFGINSLIYDDKGVRTDKENFLKSDDVSITDYFCILTEISKKIRIKMDGYFCLNFSETLDFEVQKL